METLACKELIVRVSGAGVPLLLGPAASERKVHKYFQQLETRSSVNDFYTVTLPFCLFLLFSHVPAADRGPIKSAPLPPAPHAWDRLRNLTEL